MPEEDAPPLMPGEVAYRIACCEAAAGDGEAAVAALRVALDQGMRDLSRVRSDEHWQELRADQRIRDMVGISDKRLAYAPFVLQPEAEFDRAAAQLDAAIPGLTDAQILVAMMKLVRYLDDGHARITWPENDKNMSRMLPVDMFMFPEGLSAASPDRRQTAEPARRAVRYHRPADVLGGAEHRDRHRTRD